MKTVLKSLVTETTVSLTLTVAPSKEIRANPLTITVMTESAGIIASFFTFLSSTDMENKMPVAEVKVPLIARIKEEKGPS